MATPIDLRAAAASVARGRPLGGVFVRPPRASSSEPRPSRRVAPRWLSALVGVLPAVAREALGDALAESGAPQVASREAERLLAEVRRERADLAARERALDDARADLDRGGAALERLRVELRAREEQFARAQASARRMEDEANVERRVPLGQVVWSSDASPRPLREVARLAANLQRYGQLTPVVVRPGPDGRLDLVSGYRRMAALKSINATHVRVRVVPGLDDRAAAALYLAENCLVEGAGTRAVTILAERAKVRPELADLATVAEEVSADDESTVEPLFLDELVEEARHHLAEGAAWLATLRPHWGELEPDERAGISRLVGYFAQLAPRLLS